MAIHRMLRGFGQSIRSKSYLSGASAQPPVNSTKSDVVGTNNADRDTKQRKARSSRDNRVDSLRGLMLAIMTVDHIGGPLKNLTFEPIGYVSAAEGFVFLSGYMYALVYARNARSSTDLFRRSLKRAALIYRYHMACLIAIIGLSLLSPTLIHYWSLHGITSHPVEWSLASLLLINTPTFFDILPMYIVLVLVMPAIDWALRSGKAFLVIGASVGLWGLGRFVDPIQSLINLMPIELHATFFNLLAWQLVWTLGVLMGFYRDKVQGFLSRTHPAVFVAPILFVGLIFLARHEIISLGVSTEAAALARSGLGWLRMLDMVGILTLAAWLMGRVRVTARLPWFDYIGGASIQVFTFHLMVVYITLVIGWRIQDLGGAPLYLLYTLLCLLSLTIPAYLTRRRRASA